MMREIIHKFGPAWLVKWYKAISLRSSRSRKMNTREVFTKIYNNNSWKSTQSVSGVGSETKQTETLVKELGKLINDLHISSVLDIPCGDFGWMQKVDLSTASYTGADIVEDLVIKNREKFGERRGIIFIVLDLTSDSLPQSDMILLRDCLVHLSYSDIFKALENIRTSKSKYLLTTTFPMHHCNYDIITGDWRTINLQEKPFNFPEPILIINERCTEGNGRYKDKSMALWKITDI
jgi:hypothetical protein